MCFMITMDIVLRKSNLINPGILYTFYVGMGIPLLISAGKFFIEWIRNKGAVGENIF